MIVELSEAAAAHVEAIDSWWRANRLAAPELFMDELEEALMSIGEIPSLGTVYQSRASQVRRLLLPRTHFHVYFVEEPARVYVLAVWSAFRGRQPRL